MSAGQLSASRRYPEGLAGNLKEPLMIVRPLAAGGTPTHCYDLDLLASIKCRFTSRNSSPLPIEVGWCSRSLLNASGSSLTRRLIQVVKVHLSWPVSIQSSVSASSSGDTRISLPVD